MVRMLMIALALTFVMASCQKDPEEAPATPSTEGSQSQVKAEQAGAPTPVGVTQEEGESDDSPSEAAPATTTTTKSADEAKPTNGLAKVSGKDKVDSKEIAAAITSGAALGDSGGSGLVGIGLKGTGVGGGGSAKGGSSMGYGGKMGKKSKKKAAYSKHMNAKVKIDTAMFDPNGVPKTAPEVPHDTEAYDATKENEFKLVMDHPLSTFSADVDTASYSNVRRMLTQGTLPPKGAIRIEEMINYFSYDYPAPDGPHPFSVTTEVAACPWNKDHHLMMVGLQGQKIPMKDIPPTNLVFLLDVSGSMNSANKLPLLKDSLKMVVDNLRETDTISIVVYAGAAGVVLDSVPGSDKGKITEALDKLKAGGSTAGGAGIKLAYKIAEKNFKKKGNNRVILATDGDFNVGASSDSALVDLIESKRKSGVFLTILGFGMGNYKGSKMEKLANKGNGNYAYIDTLKEARKVLVNELGATMYAIAKDVKLQIEFNPGQVKAYRLIGYETRLLAKEDFNDDTKDAGEMGAGHSVTALYELVPASSKETFGKVDELKYQKLVENPSSELCTVKLRYKEPDKDKSVLMERVLQSAEIQPTPKSENFLWVSAVAQFGMLLRESKFAGTSSFDKAIALAGDAMQPDPFGYKKEFVELCKKAKELKPAK